MASPEVARFGPYVLLERIGDGGMAEIFRAKRRGFSGFEKQLALKRILPRFGGNETFVRMLINEAKLAANLQHFNIVQVLDLGAIDGTVFLAMEYVRGRDLAAVLSRAYRRRELIPVSISLCIATEFLTGLDYAHRKRNDDGAPLGVIHRDISPQNILISYEGEVKVTDFGIARVVTEKNDQLPGNLHGKFGYMSPEQVRGKRIDQRSDIFSAGVVVWEMLTGQRLFRGSSPEETVDQVVNKPIPLPSSINADVPDAVDAVCLRALERRREARFQTVGALLGELSRISDRLSRRAAPRDVAVYMRRHFGQGLDRVQGERVPSVSAHSGFGSLTSPSRPLLGKVLRDAGAISTDDLQLGLAEQRARGGRLGDVLVQMEVVNEEVVGRAVAQQLGTAWLDESEVAHLSPPPDLHSRFPRDAAETSQAIPLRWDPSGAVRVLTIDPTQRQRLLEVKVILGVQQLEPVVTSRASFRELMQRWYPESGPRSQAPVVLLADADPDALSALAERLRDEELEVVTATDGRAAERIFSERAVSVALYDAALPRIDGLNLLLATQTRSPDTTVFISCRRRDEAFQAKALELGAEDVLTKPLSVEPTCSKLRRAAQRRQPDLPLAAVSGDLSAMPLLELIQSLEVGAKSAEIQVQYEDGRHGRVVMKRGRVHAVDPERPTPEEAFFALATPGAGRFRVWYRPTDEPGNLTAPNTFLLMEAMKRLEPTGEVRISDLTLDP
jgi:serine/threonine protein kinase/DNA-binding response OmpR family regulator